MNKQETVRGIWRWQLVRTIMGLSGLLFIAFLLLCGLTEDGIRCCIAWSAKISINLFCMAFSASAVHRLLQNSFSYWWFFNRKYFGISFALMHLLHLGFLFILQQVFHPVFTLADPVSIFGGGMAYVFLTLMLLTSFERFAKRISTKHWKWLHLIGGYWIWGIFMSTYSKALIRGEAKGGFVAILVVVLGLRIWNEIGKRKTQ